MIRVFKSQGNVRGFVFSTSVVPHTKTEHGIFVDIESPMIRAFRKYIQWIESPVVSLNEEMNNGTIKAELTRNESEFNYRIIDGMSDFGSKDMTSGTVIIFDLNSLCSAEIAGDVSRYFNLQQTESAMGDKLKRNCIKRQVQFLYKVPDNGLSMRELTRISDTLSCVYGEDAVCTINIANLFKGGSTLIILHVAQNDSVYACNIDTDGDL